MTHADFNDLETRDYIFKIGDRGKAIQARYDENTDSLIFPRAVFDYVYKLLIEALSQEPCDDAISREDALNCLNGAWGDYSVLNEVYERISKLPSVTHKSGKCKNCKYFEYDSVAKVDGMPLIVAHEICNKWGDGCKTSEDGFCFMFEESEDKE